MNEQKFTWLPFFKELLNEICLNYDKFSLCKMALEIFPDDLNDVDENGKSIKLTEIDPLTFIALFNRNHKFENKKQFYISAKRIFSLSSLIPEDVEGIPIFDPRKTWFFNYVFERGDKIIDKLWEFARIFNNKKLIDKKLFDDLLKIREQFAVTKLSQFLFICNPEKFYPADTKSRFYVYGKDVTQKNNYKWYENFVNEIKNKYPNKSPYIFSIEAEKNYKKIKESKKIDADIALKTLNDTYGFNLNQDEDDDEGNKIKKEFYVYERSPKNRAKAIKYHGTICLACDFSFNTFYGEKLAKDFIEIHHIIPVSEGKRKVDPKKDLVPVCPNCHNMIHRELRNNVLISEINDIKGRYIKNKD